jgi:hypothetical protein
MKTALLSSWQVWAVLSAAFAALTVNRLPSLGSPALSMRNL